MTARAMPPERRRNDASGRLSHAYFGGVHSLCSTLRTIGSKVVIGSLA